MGQTQIRLVVRRRDVLMDGQHSRLYASLNIFGEHENKCIPRLPSVITLSAIYLIQMPVLQQVRTCRDTQLKACPDLLLLSNQIYSRVHVYYSTFAKDNFYYSVLLLCICNKYDN